MVLDVKKVREDFPILEREVNGRKIIYLDNAATSQKPRQVIEAVSRFYREYNANIHRGLHKLSQEASEAYEEAHEVVAKFIGARSWEEVVFTYNATESLNLIAFTWGLKYLDKGDEVVLTIMEHHSNMLPWRTVAKLKGAKVKYVDIREDGTLNYDNLAEELTPRTKFVAVTMMSNVLGTIVDVRRVIKEARQVGALVVVDGAQGVPHLPVDVSKLDIDFLAFSGHKMLGPTGIGVLWGRRELLEEVEPFKSGGGSIKDVTKDSVMWHEVPWRFEAGTPNIAGAIGLAEAAKYLMRLGMEEVREHERRLTELTLRLFERELGRDVKYYGPSDTSLRGGVVSFNVEGLHHHIVGRALDLFGIAVRTGMHCAHPLHYRLGLTGTVRASYYIYNTEEEVRELIDTLRRVVVLREEFSKGEVSDFCPGT